MNRIPFTYRLSWTSLNKHYFGVKFSKNCNPIDLWTTYFTSSKYVSEFIEQNGNPDIVKVTKTFSTPEQALSWELKFLKKVSANKNDIFLNRSIGFGDHHNYKDGFSTSEIQNKVDATLKRKYGGRLMNSPIIRKKIEDTCMMRYNGKTSINRDKVQKARQDACLKKYGTKNPYESPLFFQLHENPMKNPIHRENHLKIMREIDWSERNKRTVEHNKEKYGVENYFQSDEFLQLKESLKVVCPFGCNNNHRFTRSNIGRHMKFKHGWTNEQTKTHCKEINEN